MGNTVRGLAGATPIGELRPSTRATVAELLDRRGTMYNGHLNDINGVMELASLTNGEIEDIKHTDPFLRQWKRLATTKGQDPPTVLTAWIILEKLGREDVIEACQAVVDDIMTFQASQSPVTSPVVRRCITRDDANNPYGIYQGYKIYDAFVMSVQSDDGFLKIFVERLEQASLSLLVPERDLLPGSAVYDTWAYAIQCRCRKLILLISEDFMESESSSFVVNFTQALTPAAEQRKIIPVKLDGTPIYPILNFVHCFTVNDDSDWDLLKDAVRSPMNPPMERSVSWSGARQTASVTPVRRVESSIDSDTASIDFEGRLESLTRLSIGRSIAHGPVNQGPDENSCVGASVEATNRTTARQQTDRHSAPDIIYQRDGGSRGASYQRPNLTDPPLTPPGTSNVTWRSDRPSERPAGGDRASAPALVLTTAGHGTVSGRAARPLDRTPRGESRGSLSLGDELDEDDDTSSRGSGYCVIQSSVDYRRATGTLQQGVRNETVSSRNDLLARVSSSSGNTDTSNENNEEQHTGVETEGTQPDNEARRQSLEPVVDDSAKHTDDMSVISEDVRETRGVRNATGELVNAETASTSDDKIVEVAENNESARQLSNVEFFV